MSFSCITNYITMPTARLSFFMFAKWDKIIFEGESLSLSCFIFTISFKIIVQRSLKFFLLVMSVHKNHIATEIIQTLSSFSRYGLNGPPWSTRFHRTQGRRKIWGEGPEGESIEHVLLLFQSKYGVYGGHWEMGF